MYQMIQMTQKCGKNVASFSYSNYGVTFLRFFKFNFIAL